MIKEITSKSNKFYKCLKELKEKGGKKEELILIEGLDLLEMAKNNGVLKYIVALNSVDGYEDFDTYILSKDLYRELSSYKSIPVAMGVASYKLSKTFGNKVIYLDGVQDPGNLGTIIRTASAFGYSGVALSNDCVSPYNTKAIQATKGAIFNLPIGYVELTDFTSHKIYFTVLDGKIVEGKVKNDTPFVLVFGNEGTGIRKEHLTIPGEKVKLDIANIDSLNVAIAAGVFMFLFKE